MTMPSTELEQASAYTLRPTTRDDFDTYYDLYAAKHVEEYGAFHGTRADFESELLSPGFDLATDTLGVFTSDGRMIAVAELWATSALPVHPVMWITMLPEHRGRGLEAKLCAWCEQRARGVFAKVPEDARVVLAAYMKEDNQWGRATVEAFGMTAEQRSHSMVIDLDDEPPAPEWPEGIRVVTYAEHPNLREFVIAHRESFRDHRGFTDAPLEHAMERWQHSIDNSEDFDPNLWVLALAGDEPAGVMMAWPSSEEDADQGWIDVVGVMRDHRRKGLGTALLREGFHRIRGIGKARAGLGVDAHSLTGATRLYERAGMRVNYAHIGYEKELRPGRELSVQSL
ncbi:MAG: GNAT family N-acetyltransferase [Chloroflexi bacterium]|nr:GNAT family N-acetyltransferase [Chloroflexota bacterium]